MTPRQIAALQHLTSTVDSYGRYSHGGPIGDYCNGPIVSDLRIVGTKGEVMVSIHNATEEHRWFESSLHVIAFVSLRGAVKVSRWDGMPRNCIDDKYLRQRTRRAMREMRANLSR